ncbi:vWA domain-containing protein [Hyalangium rubrum]|uniref:von Willebrand factor type A domain-containing protein n=1 Tax=Hyalangium rubrum TaxID=3103134 RepID=A0ABU5H5B2_9BACT|nr:von Willebrand factor type A domain-containing protein [Hyalangium sp. s54d21]MDY7227275.1 von Willebrand factor type A domain-containing protein [Hyalangium sp. s54d21]
MKKKAAKNSSLSTIATVTVLVVVGVVAIITLFGDNFRKLFGASASALAGNDEVASAPSPQLLQKKTMRSFGSNDAYEGSPPAAAAPAPAPALAVAPAEPVTAGNTHVAERPNPFTLTSEDTLSTFAVDVDTASYALFRRNVNEGALPPRESVRVEEWVNYFKYRLPTPEKGDFHVDLEGAPSPFTSGRQLIKVGLQGRKIGKSQRKPTHLVFLADTSGSMGQPDKLPLAQRAMKLMVDGLNEQDTVALVTYAGSVRDVLPPTPASERTKLFAAIDALTSGGGTAMGDGMQIAYQHAAKNAGPDKVARVVVLTDGDTNIGRNQSADAILESVRGYVQEGVTLSTIGFGMGNYRDDLMERLANKGNGNCYYIDSEKEARRVFQEQLAGTLEVIAKDVKVQVEFDKVAVRGYRLLGYENRAIADQDFRNDKVDAGEIGAGHSVTALYEVELTGEGSKVATVRVRAKTPSGSEAAEQSFAFPREQLHGKLADASSDMRFATAVAGTADILRGAPQASDWSLSVAEELAQGAIDGMEDREEFVSLLRRVREAKLENVSSGRTTYNRGY